MTIRIKLDSRRRFFFSREMFTIALVQEFPMEGGATASTTWPLGEHADFYYAERLCKLLSDLIGVPFSHDVVPIDR
jgi:hypothetical protein